MRDPVLQFLIGRGPVGAVVLDSLAHVGPLVADMICRLPSWTNQAWRAVRKKGFGYFGIRPSLPRLCQNRKRIAVSAIGAAGFEPTTS